MNGALTGIIRSMRAIGWICTRFGHLVAAVAVIVMMVVVAAGTRGCSRTSCYACILLELL